MKRPNLIVAALALSLSPCACVVPPGSVGELPPGTGESGDDGSGGSASGESGTDGESDGGSSGEPPPMSNCGPDGPTCKLDGDGDCVELSEDNAPDVYNPDQGDMDGDGFGDVADLCPTLAGPADDVADSDDDGIGNECDPCRQPSAVYNIEAANPMGYMRVRNIASVADSDGDGIGDACDNCVTVANCEGYGPAAPWQPGDPIAYDDPVLCQTDSDQDMTGDACAGMQAPGAAGVVGLGPDDDFDQDGLSNVVDACPRLPLTVAMPCASDGDCPDGRTCEETFGLCDHLDRDADGVGDRCDTCPTVENPLQVADGAMQQGDDSDGDFVGNACEPGLDCDIRNSPRRIGFYPVSVGGMCCTVDWRGDGSILDPDGLPVTAECSDADEGVSCRRVPVTVEFAPGMMLLPPGCGDALADAGLTVETHVPLTEADVGSLDALWAMSCSLPPLDQDFDGLGDVCDLCPHAFDPVNEPFIDDNGMLWPNDGRYCNGDYSLDNCG